MHESRHSTDPAAPLVIVAVYWGMADILQMVTCSASICIARPALPGLRSFDHGADARRVERQIALVAVGILQSGADFAVAHTRPCLSLSEGDALPRQLGL